MKKTNKKLIGIILIISLFICVGFAQISNINLNITGKVGADVQSAVFISDATTANSSSKVNYYTGTMLDTTTVLGTSTSSTVSYDVTLYNASEKDYVFIGVLTLVGAVTGEEGFYSNPNIDYTLTGLEEGKTVIPKKTSLTFTITFKYAGTDTSNNILESKLNFRFREAPVLNLSNEGKEYTLENIYPDYTPAEYEFTVSNKEDNVINNVEMRYNFETTIDGPLTAKIYDANGKEVTENITINGEGQTEISNKYTLKIIWDNSKGTGYNSTEYANKDYTCNIKLIAVPTDADYGEYNLTKEFNVKIKTAPFYLNTAVDATNLTLSNNQASVGLTVNNYSSSTAYNKYETKYEISLKDTSKYTITVEDAKSGKISSGANSNAITVKFTAKDGVTLNAEEKVTLIVKATSPYAYTKELETITINNAIPVESVTITGSTDVIDSTAWDALQLTATVLPANATNKDVYWWSSDSLLAWVDESYGLVSTSDVRLWKYRNNICRGRWCIG